ncbi:hypothetical protein [Chryseobacterium sp. MYb7]|uniref:hypothetical protein n=1 Tax=Chryseobacterium sp. MYb7 TaxID=1827290 RepID=UPI002937317C|nr:hypothetical protein [Chryseobacterium sp. MYb7]
MATVCQPFNWERFADFCFGFHDGCGVIEILVGIIVLKKAEIGGYIVAGWLTVIAITLLLSFNFIDVAVRDLVMAIAALSMAKIAKILS